MTSLLLDTHASIWFLTGNPRLSRGACAAKEDPDIAVLASAANGYEIACKARLGKLAFPVVEELPAMIRKARIAVHPLTLDRALAAGRLPGPHRDP